MKVRKKVVGIMGGAAVAEDVERIAERLGAGIAKRGWVLLTGGRPAGVMQAASRGASREGGLVVGVLPGPDPDDCADGVSIAIATGMSDARNAINVLSSDVVIALPGGAGTLSEVALAVKNRRPVVLLGIEPHPALERAKRAGLLRRAGSVEEAIDIVAEFLTACGG